MKHIVCSGSVPDHTGYALPSALQQSLVDSVSALSAHVAEAIAAHVMAMLLLASPFLSLGTFPILEISPAC